MGKILSYKFLFTVGAILVIIGFIVPLLMVMEIIPGGLIWLQLMIGVMQMLGLIAGILGSVLYVKEKRK